MTDELWPLPVREAAEELFGGRIHNPQSRTHKSLDRRIRHALGVWRDRYVGLNAEQLEYAGEVLAWAIRQSLAARRADGRYPYALTVLEKVVNHPRVHDGMMRRSGFVKVDVLKELVS